MPHPAVASAHAAVKKLSLALKAHILSGPHSLIELGAAIGRSTNYLSATFRGENPLKMRDVFALFEAMGERPRPFFKRLYPLSPGPPAEGEQLLRLPSGETFTFRDVIERGFADLPVPLAAELTAKAGRLLIEHMKRARLHQLETSRLLIDGKAHALGQALRGGQDLEVYHVFGVLALLDLGPDLFFAQLLWPEHPSLENLETARAMQRLLGVLPPAGGR